jgi:hypothetical protein
MTGILVFSLAALFGLAAGAQTVTPPMAPIAEPGAPQLQAMPQLGQVPPQEAQLQAQDPQDQANQEQPQAPLLLPAGGEPEPGPEAQQAPPQSQFDPRDPSLAYPPADLGPDNDIAQTYDDGYDPRAYGQFQNDLAPYGSWVNDPTYGNVWSPYASTVGADFVPYASRGHWIMSEYGWTWVSDWSWGWAPFHYGRWTTIAGRGWSWIPGTMWGPAWVSWRSGNGYVGWSPLPPRGAPLFAGTGARSPWRFTTAAGLGATRPSFVSSRYLPSLFARTTVVANDRLLTRGQWTVHVNAGPTRGMNAVPVRMATAAPHALPRVAVYPHAGVPLSARPWTQAGVAHQGAYGQSGFGQGVHGQGAYERGWNAGATPQHAVGRAPAYGPTPARPAVRAPANTWSRPTQSYYGSASSYGRPFAAGGSYAPAARSYAAPSYASAQPATRAAAAAPTYYHAPSYTPVQHSYATPSATRFGGMANFGSSGGGSHFGGGGGGSHFGGGGGGSHFGGGGGGHRR